MNTITIKKKINIRKKEKADCQIQQFDFIETCHAQGNQLTQ